ncbi:hypothetical protein V8C42DRAFT_347967 [Trichoderma barbatum]
MAQGTIKKSTKAAAPKAVHSKRQASKVSKPKKKVNADKLLKKFTSGMKGSKKLSQKGGSKKFG